MAKGPARSPLAPEGFPDLPTVGGVRFATAASGVKYKGRNDLMLALMTEGTTLSGSFTKSATRAPSILDCQAKIGGAAEGAAAIIVNAGNANAFTGAAGMASVKAIVAGVSEAAGIAPEWIFTNSTGVIGEPLDHDKIVTLLPDMAKAAAPGGIAEAAEAILTTDTFAKGAGATVSLAGGEVHIAGIAKGSGMIAPNMATMLVYIFTDAALEAGWQRGVTNKIVDRTFNCITVDSDTSTSDSLLLAATGASGVDATDDAAFEAALHDVMLDLAQQVVRDGEGATKFIEVSVSGAVDAAQAKTHALAIANSPLVKTAIAGEDANWGRIVMALGKSGAEADPDRIAIRFGEIEVAKDGARSPGYSEEDAAAYMQNETIEIHVDLNLGPGTARVWTCDLTHGYISINADYRS